MYNRAIWRDSILTYVTLGSEDAEAVAYYLKNVLPAIKNEIPVPALKEGFDEMVPETQNQLPRGVRRYLL